MTHFWTDTNYWTDGDRKHIFAVKSKTKAGVDKVYQVIGISSIGIRRHIKIKAASNPYLPEFARYFWERRYINDSKLLSKLSAREFKAQFA